MYPQSHLLSGLATGAIAQKLGYFSYQDIILLTCLTTGLDIDHYLYYACKYKTLDLSKAWQAAVIKKETGERTAIHHSLGFLLFTFFLIILFFFDRKWALILGLAYYLHILLDYLPLGKKNVKFKILGFNFNLTWAEIFFDFILLILLIVLLNI